MKHTPDNWEGQLLKKSVKKSAFCFLVVRDTKVFSTGGVKKEGTNFKERKETKEVSTIVRLTVHSKRP